ncbi:MAG TPA: endonuclease MutS2, partial [Candidatus Binataceae bacterium]|nr:endonuclease MutS2 [Candidatus Binataceae bacterium]
MRERDLKALEFDKVIRLLGDMCVSEPGREAIAQLQPSVDSVEVRTRLRTTAEMREFRSHTGSVPIGEFSDQRALLLTAARSGAILGGEALVRVRDFVAVARNVAAFMRSRVEPFPHLATIVRNLLAPEELADALAGSIADDGSVLDDASPELFRLRTRLRAERTELEARLLRSLSSPGMESFVSDYLVTVRNRRFVLPLKLNYTERIEGIVQDRSVSGETLFVEPMWAVELNNRLMMLEREAEAEETRILANLTAMVGGYAEELRLAFDAMVALDGLNARAIFAERYNCVEPEISESGVEFIGARHPLLLDRGREIIPIDLKIAPGQQGIVISGPNTGGKTVALKTLGLLSLMAQAGLLIPATRGAKATVFRGVFADIGDEQSIEANLSSFSGHIANLSDIIRSLKEPALVILDEPGAGTDPVEGAALAIGVMSHLAARGCVVVVATHSTALKLYAYSRPGYDAAAVDFDEEQMAPLYQLKPHTIGQSYGLAIARRLGMPEEIISAARDALGAGSLELSDALRRLEDERASLHAEAEKLRAREHSLATAELEAREAAARQRETAGAERTRIRAEAKELLSQIRTEGAALMEEIKHQGKSRGDLRAFAAKAETQVEELLPQPEPQSEAPLKPGDRVEVGDLSGELLILEPGRAVIGRGGLRIEVAPERLKRAAASGRDRAPAEKQPTVTFTAERADSSELNLIGMRAADALRKLEDYLDDAFLANRPEVRIVHGIGSGALRKAIAEYLQTSPYCSSFHQAEPHQGGAGATIVL